MKTRYKVAAVLSVVTLVTGTAVANSVLNKPEYILPANDAVAISPLAYAGDVINGVTVRGIPDGMGAMRNEDGTITLLSSHEVPSYGAVGA